MQFSQYVCMMYRAMVNTCDCPKRVHPNRQTDLTDEGGTLAAAAMH